MGCPAFSAKYGLKLVGAALRPLSEAQEAVFGESLDR
jgi:hypothetical protein